MELVDVHDGFRVITDRIATKDRVKLLWIIFGHFFPFGWPRQHDDGHHVRLLQNWIKKQEDLWLFGGFVIIAANAGAPGRPLAT